MRESIHIEQNIKEYAVNIGEPVNTVDSLLPLHFNYLNTF
jgi:hypothetical protein